MVRILLSGLLVLGLARFSAAQSPPPEKPKTTKLKEKESLMLKANLLLFQGKHAEAAVVIEKILKLEVSVLGPEHADAFETLEWQRTPKANSRNSAKPRPPSSPSVNNFPTMNSFTWPRTVSLLRNPRKTIGLRSALTRRGSPSLLWAESVLALGHRLRRGQ
jgi:hypothetical protein